MANHQRVFEIAPFEPTFWGWLLNIPFMARAFDAFERAYAKRTGGILTFGVDRRLDPLRSDPRFEDLLRRIGFPAS